MNLSLSSRSFAAVAVPAFALILALLALPAPLRAGGGGSPPSGRYVCSKISGSSFITLGNLEIKGDTYRGLEDSGEFHKFTVDGSGNITWTAGLVGFPDGWKLTKSHYIGVDKDMHKPLIKIYYMSPSGALEVLDALQE